MSVLIPGMEMPTSCVDCRFHKSVYCTLTDICTNTAQRCPLVPVPPHGRLIDADGEMHVILKMMPEGTCDVKLIAPTVIPADPDKEVE